MNHTPALAFYLIVLMVSPFIGHGQIEFFGVSSPVNRLNTAASEDFLCLHPAGERLVFTRINYDGNVGGKNDGGDLWVSDWGGVNWGAASNWLALNDHNMTTPIGFSVSGNQFIYNYLINDAQGVRSELRIYRADGSMDVLPTKYLNNSSVHQTGTLSVDESFIILSMQSSATKGNEDLYVLKYESGEWSPPINLGPVINTPSQEITPFLAADNQTLFFATNGRNGAGGFDLYYSRRLDDSWRNWSEPVSLGPKVNTSGAETGFVFQQGGDHAFFVSTIDSDGYGNIRRIAIKPQIQAIDQVDTLPISANQIQTSLTGVRVVDARTGKPVSGEATVIYNGKNKTRMNLGAVDGLIRINLGITTVEVKKIGFLPAKMEVKPKEVVEMPLKPLEVGTTITLENVLFYRASAKMLEESYKELDEIVLLLNQNPTMNILLKGHTDNRGDVTANMKLSDERVVAVANYLIERGIKSKRVKGKGFGGSQPVAPNDTEENRSKNRRVEFQIIK